jgi:hypothetical protein
MKNIVTFIRFTSKKELKRIEKRLIENAKIYGFDIVHGIQVDYENSVSMNLIEALNELLQENIRVEAIMVERYNHLHTYFFETAELIKKLSHFGVRIISIEETVDENDPLFTQIYHPLKLRES